MAAEPSGKIVLHYFDIRGKGEPLRLQFEDTGVEYEDVRIPRANWFGGVKDEYKAKGLSPFGQIPVVQIGDTCLAQSTCIARYFAKKAGIYGSNDYEQFLVDEVVAAAEDWRSSYSSFIYGSQDFEKEKPVWIEKNLHRFLSENNTHLKKNANGTKYFVGNDVTFCDYWMWEMVDLALLLSPNCLDKYPELKGYHARFAARPRIKAYLASGKRPLKANNNGKQ